MKIVLISYEMTFGWRLRQSLTNSIILRPNSMIWCPQVEIPFGWRLMVFQPSGNRSWDLADTVEVRNQDFLPMFFFRTTCKDDRARARARPVKRGSSADSWATGPQNRDSALVRPRELFPRFERDEFQVRDEDEDGPEEAEKTESSATQD